MILYNVRRRRHKSVTLADLLFNKITTYPPTTTMKFSVFAVTALAAATSFSCFVSAAAAAASRKRKITKKVTDGPNGATGPPTPDGIPIGGYCVSAEDNCAIPQGLNHGVCYGICPLTTT